MSKYKYYEMILRNDEQEIIPEIKDVKELSNHLKPLYIISDYISPIFNDKGIKILSAKHNYIEFKEKLFEYMKGCFEKIECQNYMVNFKFYKDDLKTHSLRFVNFMSNVFIWYAFINLWDIDHIMTEDIIFKCDTEEDASQVNNFLDHKILPILQEYYLEPDIINQTIADILYDLRRISNEFSMIMNIQFSLEDFIKMRKEIPEFKELMDVEFESSMQPADIEHALAEKEKKLIEISKKSGNNIGLILNAKSIKTKQYTEFTVSQGLKPDINGETIPIPINNSNLTGGANRADYHYIDATGARKSLIQNKETMGRAGYFAKICASLGLDLRLSKNVYDCGAKHLLDIYINDQKMLNKFNGRYYLTDEGLKKNAPLKAINSKKDQHLIGRWVHLRSPITCVCGDNDVCHVCFGRNSLLNKDISNGITGFEVEEWTKVVSQMILSTKHLLTTVSENIKFNSDFYKFFEFTHGEINLKSNIIDDIPNIDLSEYALYLPSESLSKSEEFDDDSSFNTYIDTKFYIVNLVTGEKIEIYSLIEREMYLTNECLDLREKGKGYIKLSDIDNFSSLFIVPILNNELTKPLYSIMELINTNKKLEENSDITYHQVAQRFVQLLVDSKIDAMAIAGELILNRMIRNNPDTNLLRPDFTKKKVPKYKIVTVNYALEHNRSAFLGQVFSYIKRQILSDEIVTIKDAPSYVDALFNEKVSFDVIKAIHEKLINEDIDF